MSIGVSVTDLNFSAVNPWQDDSKAISSIRSSLLLAEQMGLKPLNLESDTQCAQVVAKLDSTKLISLLKEIRDKNKYLLQVKMKLYNLSQEVEVAEFLSPEAVERKISLINHLCTDLDLVLTNVHALVNHLQKPRIGEGITMDASYHGSAKKMFTQLVPTMNELSVHLEHITWAGNQDLSSSHLEPLLVKVQSLTASVQTSCYMLSRVKDGVQMLNCDMHSSSGLDVSQESLSSHHSNRDCSVIQQ